MVILFKKKTLKNKKSKYINTVSRLNENIYNVKKEIEELKI